MFKKKPKIYTHVYVGLFSFTLIKYYYGTEYTRKTVQAAVYRDHDITGKTINIYTSYNTKQYIFNPDVWEHENQLILL